MFPRMKIWTFLYFWDDYTPKLVSLKEEKKIKRNSRSLFRNTGLIIIVDF